MTTPTDALKLARDALAAMIGDSQYKTIQGESAWHVKAMPTTAALDMAREAIAAINALPASVPSGEPAEPVYSKVLNDYRRTSAQAAPAPAAASMAFATHHDEPMLFTTAAEAGQYCEDDERPIPLCRCASAAPAVAAPERLPANVKACVLSAIERGMQVLEEVATGRTLPRHAIRPVIERLAFAKKALKGEASLQTSTPTTQETQ